MARWRSAAVAWSTRRACASPRRSRQEPDGSSTSEAPPPGREQRSRPRPSSDTKAAMGAKAPAGCAMRRSSPHASGSSA
eukprot:scaffold13527_cov95-Isochrysis_galbana.AAC.3